MTKQSKRRPAAPSVNSPAGESGVFSYDIHETLLPNGLKVVAIPFESVGLVAYWTVVRTGSRNEVEPGKSGFAHFFEHMMFRGTERYPKKRYNDILKGLGTDHNAFTSDDYTAYHILGPSSGLGTMMELEADRFMNLDYPVEDFEKEAGAVLGEYNKSASNPFQTLFEKLRDAAYTVHSYKHTTIGFLRDIKEMPRQYDYSRVFFERFYRPENCILLAVGDVAPQNVFDLAGKHYGAWKRGAHRLEVPAEPPQKEENRVEADWPNPTQPFLLAGYHGPSFSTSRIDLPALDLISQLMFSESAPLYQKLVIEEQEADILSGGQPDHLDPYLFTILARIKRAERIGYVEEAITAALEGLKSDGVETERLERVKSHMKYAYAMGLNTAENVSGNLAHYLALTGDARAVNSIYALYDRVTPEDIASVAARYFVRDTRTVVTLQHRESARPAAEES